MSKNYAVGSSYENRFTHEMMKNGAIISKRFYASKGITDVYWVDQDCKYNEAQLKYSSKTPRISKKELARLKAYARLNPFPVYLIMKSKKVRKATWERLN